LSARRFGNTFTVKGVKEISVSLENIKQPKKQEDLGHY
jgi:hypothetical protein